MRPRTLGSICGVSPSPGSRNPLRRRSQRAESDGPRSGDGGERGLRVLVYSSNRAVRAAVLSALGPRPDPALPEMEFVEAATAPMVLRHAERTEFDLLILDGEAAPTGGMGLSRQLGDELDACPPILVLIGRREDAWLAEWSRADDAVAHPLDPFELSRAVVALVRPAS